MLNEKCEKLAEIFGFKEIGEGRRNNIRYSLDQIAQEHGYAGSITDYFSYRWYDSEKGLFANNGNIIGFMLEISPIVGVTDNLLEDLNRFFKDDMPENGFLQFMLVASHDINPVFDIWEKGKISKNPFLRKLAASRREFLEKLSVNFGSSNSLIARNFKIYLNFAKKLDWNNQNISDLSHFREGLIRRLSNLKLAPRSCDADDLIGLVREIIYMGRGKEKIYDKYNEVSDQILPPLTKIEFEEDHISCKGIKSSFFHITQLPQEFSLADMVSLLGSHKGDLGINARFMRLL